MPDSNANVRELEGSPIRASNQLSPARGEVEDLTQHREYREVHVEQVGPLHGRNVSLNRSVFHDCVLDSSQTLDTRERGGNPLALYRNFGDVQQMSPMSRLKQLPV